MYKKLQINENKSPSVNQSLISATNIQTSKKKEKPQKLQRINSLTTRNNFKNINTDSQLQRQHGSSPQLRVGSRTFKNSPERQNPSMTMTNYVQQQKNNYFNKEVDFSQRLEEVGYGGYESQQPEHLTGWEHPIMGGLMELTEEDTSYQNYPQEVLMSNNYFADDDNNLYTGIDSSSNYMSLMLTNPQPGANKALLNQSSPTKQGNMSNYETEMRHQLRLPPQQMEQNLMRIKQQKHNFVVAQQPFEQRPHTNPQLNHSLPSSNVYNSISQNEMGAKPNLATTEEFMKINLGAVNNTNNFFLSNPHTVKHVRTEQTPGGGHLDSSAKGAPLERQHTQKYKQQYTTVQGPNQQADVQQIQYLESKIMQVLDKYLHRDASPNSQLRNPKANTQPLNMTKPFDDTTLHASKFMGSPPFDESPILEEQVQPSSKQLAQNNRSPPHLVSSHSKEFHNLKKFSEGLANKIDSIRVGRGAALGSSDFKTSKPIMKTGGDGAGRSTEKKHVSIKLRSEKSMPIKRTTSQVVYGGQRGPGTAVDEQEIIFQNSKEIQTDEILEQAEDQNDKVDLLQEQLDKAVYDSMKFKERNMREVKDQYSEIKQLKESNAKFKNENILQQDEIVKLKELVKNIRELCGSEKANYEMIMNLKDGMLSELTKKLQDSVQKFQQIKNKKEQTEEMHIKKIEGLEENAQKREYELSQKNKDIKGLKKQIEEFQRQEFIQTNKVKKDRDLDEEIEKWQMEVRVLQQENTTLKGLVHDFEIEKQEQQDYFQQQFNDVQTKSRQIEQEYLEAQTIIIQTKKQSELWKVKESEYLIDLEQRGQAITDLKEHIVGLENTIKKQELDMQGLKQQMENELKQIQINLTEQYDEQIGELNKQIIYHKELHTHSQSEQASINEAEVQRLQTELNKHEEAHKSFELKYSQALHKVSALEEQEKLYKNEEQEKFNGLKGELVKARVEHSKQLNQLRKSESSLKEESLKQFQEMNKQIDDTKQQAQAQASEHTRQIQDLIKQVEQAKTQNAKSEAEQVQMLQKYLNEKENVIKSEKEQSQVLKQKFESRVEDLQNEIIVYQNKFSSLDQKYKSLENESINKYKQFDQAIKSKQAEVEQIQTKNHVLIEQIQLMSTQIGQQKSEYDIKLKELQNNIQVLVQQKSHLQEQLLKDKHESIQEKQIQIQELTYQLQLGEQQNISKLQKLQKEKSDEEQKLTQEIKQMKDDIQNKMKEQIADQMRQKKQVRELEDNLVKQNQIVYNQLQQEYDNYKEASSKGLEGIKIQNQDLENKLKLLQENLDRKQQEFNLLKDDGNKQIKKIEELNLIIKQKEQQTQNAMSSNNLQQQQLLTQFQSTIQSKDEQCAKLQGDLKLQEQLKIKFENDLQLKEAAIQSLKSQIDASNNSKDQGIQQLQSQIMNLKLKITEADSKSSQLQQQNQQCNEQIEEFKSNIIKQSAIYKQEIQNSKEENQKFKQELEAHIKSSQAELLSLQEQNSKLKQEIDQFMNKEKSVTQENSVLRNSMESTYSDVQNLKQQVNQKQQKISELEGQTKLLGEQISKAKDDQHLKESKTNELIQQLNMQEQQIQQLQASSQTKDQQASEQQKQTATTKQKVKQLTDQLDQKDQAIKEQVNAVTQISSQLQKLQSEKCQKCQQLPILEEKVTYLSDELQTKGQIMEGMKQKLIETTGLQDELKKKNSILMVKEAEIANLNRLAKDQKETIEQDDNSKQLSELKKTSLFQKQEQAMKNMLIEQLKKELEKMAMEMMNGKEKEAIMANQISQLNKELQKYKK